MAPISVQENIRKNERRAEALVMIGESASKIVGEVKRLSGLKGAHFSLEHTTLVLAAI